MAFYRCILLVMYFIWCIYRCISKYYFPEIKYPYYVGVTQLPFVMLVASLLPIGLLQLAGGAVQ